MPPPAIPTLQCGPSSSLTHALDLLATPMPAQVKELADMYDGMIGKGTSRLDPIWGGEDDLGL